ncbi:MAG: S-layer homology domain-containing protein [Clostridiales bacterium]
MLFKLKFIMIFLIFVFIKSNLVYGVSINEEPINIYKGSIDNSFIYQNIDYYDIKNSDIWSKEAIYQAGALGLMKGYGNRIFSRKDYVTNEQLLAVILRIAGLEEVAKKKSDEIILKNNIKNKEPLNSWARGYLQVANDQQIITDKQLEDSLVVNQNTLNQNDFLKGKPATREDLAYWLSLALKIVPVYDENKILNNYKDWRNADSNKIPYIEALLRKNIMNGDSKGSFLPKGYVTREQLAQVCVNLDDEFLKSLKINKNTGTIEKIQKTDDKSSGENVLKTTFYIRDIDGNLDLLESYKILSESNLKNEITGNSIDKIEDFPVYNNTTLTNSDSLVKGDLISYYYDENKKIRFVKTKLNNSAIKYYLVRINDINVEKNILDINRIKELNSLNLNIFLDGNINELINQNKNAIYTYSNDVTIIDNRKIISENDIKLYSYVIIELKNNEIIRINSSNLHDMSLESNVVNGTVENINFDLGYIDIYEYSYDNTISSKTYKFNEPDEIEVFKDGNKSDIKNIEIGDLVFMKIDNEKYINGISALNNVITKYGIILKNLKESISIEDDNGFIQTYKINSELIIYSEGKEIELSQLRDGDHIKLSIQIANNYSKLKEISVEKYENEIQDIYKGYISSVDKKNNQIVLYNLKTFKSGKWFFSDVKGYTNFKLAKDVEIINSNKKVNIDDINKNNLDVYLIVKKIYGKYLVSKMVLDESNSDEIIIKDKIINKSGTEISFENSYKTINILQNSIIIKNNRIVSSATLKSNDKVSIITMQKDDKYIGMIVNIHNDSNINLDIFRGKIISIDEGESFTTEKYSKLDQENKKWNYYSESMNFKFDNNTKFTDKNGLINQRDFINYGSNSYKDSIVNIVREGDKTLLVSIDEFANKVHSGTVYNKNIDQTTALETVTLRNVEEFDNSLSDWKNIDKEYVVNLSKTTIVFKEGKLIDFNDIEKNDFIEVYSEELVTGVNEINSIFIFVKN